MKATIHYLMIVLLLVVQLGCAHTPRHPSKEMTVRSTKDSELNPAPAKGQALRIATGTTKGLVVGTVMGALIGAAAGFAVTAATGGIGIVVAPYLIVGGTAVGAGIGGLSGGIAGGVNSAQTSERGRIVYDTRKGVRFVQIDSLQPVLQWKTFPTAKDIKADKAEELSRITEVTYELRILGAQDSVPGDVVYTRKGLQDSSHKVEHRLTPLTRYFWSIRVRFKLDDDYKETKWIHGPPFYTTM